MCVSIIIIPIGIQKVNAKYIMNVFLRFLSSFSNCCFRLDDV